MVFVMISVNKYFKVFWCNFYGCVYGKIMNQVQKDYLDEDLEVLLFGDVSWEINFNCDLIDMVVWFKGKLVWLEIGFGGGEYFVYMGEIYFDVEIIGCEFYINGVVMLLGKICWMGMGNVVVYFGDVCDLFDVIFDGFIEKVFLNYFDLWFKKCYYCCCFVMVEYFELLFCVLKLGVEFCVVMDIEDYVC